MKKSAFWLANVQMEQGYKKDQKQIIGTETMLSAIRIEGGVFTEIVDMESMKPSDLPIYDARGLLLLPSFEEAHIHLDKTYYGRAWHAVKPIRSIFERIEEEQILLPELMQSSQQQAELILALIQGYGSTHVRTHCNIEPTSGLKRLESTRKALEMFANRLSSEIVAFPQHGLLHSQSVDLMKQALTEGATHVGGVDPHTVDGDVEKSLQTMMELAVLHNAPIDIHLHETGENGKNTLLKLVQLTEEAGKQGQVTISHGFWFATADPHEAEEMADKFAALEMGLASTVPIGKMMMPLPMLQRKGVKVKLGTDSLTDHWSPFGSGDPLEKAQRFAELYGRTDELALSQTLSYITGGVTPLNSNGNRTWPMIGDSANFTLIEASCSAEAVARKSTCKAVWYNGEMVSGTLSDSMK